MLTNGSSPKQRQRSKDVLSLIFIGRFLLSARECDCLESHAIASLRFRPCIIDGPEKLQSSSFSLSIFVKVVDGRELTGKGGTKCIICPLCEVISGTFRRYWVLINFISHFISSYTDQHRFSFLSLCMSQYRVLFLRRPAPIVNVI